MNRSVLFALWKRQLESMQTLCQSFMTTAKQIQNCGDGSCTRSRQKNGCCSLKFTWQGTIHSCRVRPSVDSSCSFEQIVREGKAFPSDNNIWEVIHDGKALSSHSFRLCDWKPRRSLTTESMRALATSL